MSHFSNLQIQLHMDYTIADRDFLEGKKLRSTMDW